MAQVGQMRPDLMEAAGPRPGAQEGNSFAGGETLEFGDGRGALAHGLADFDLAILPTKGGIHGHPSPGDGARDQGEVFFFHAMADEMRGERAGGLRVLGQEERSAGLSVEAVDEMEALVRELAL